MKSSKRCPGCNSADIGHLESLYDQGAEGSYQALGVIDYRPLVWTTGTIGGKRAIATSGSPKGGRLELRAARAQTVTKANTVSGYVCVRCGLLERYVQDPEWAEFDRLRNFRRLDRSKESEVMRDDATCSKCAGTNIGHLSSLPDTVGDEREIGVLYAGTIERDGQQRPIAKLEAIVCTDCGYLETYVADPTNTPFEQMQEFSKIVLTDGAPYR